MHNMTLKYLLFLISAFLLIQCAPDDPRHPVAQSFHSLDSLNSILLRQLETHRVVMLADAQPGHIAYSSCVSSFLRTWLDCLQRAQVDTTIPRKLLLVLELGQSGATAVNHYLKTGDRNLLIRFLIDEQAKFKLDAYLTRNLSVDYLQFCEELRVLCERSDLLNRKNPANRILIDVAGFEPDPPYSHLDIRTKTRQQILSMKAQWDRTQRDAKSAPQLVGYLAEHPQSKVLYFTSALHLYRDAADGIFVARILDSLLGRPNVSVFQVHRNPRTPASGPQIEEYKHTAESADFLVRKRMIPPRPVPFFLIKTQNSFRAMIDLAEQYSTSLDTLDTDLSRKLLSHALDLLRRSHLALEPKTNQEIAFLQSTVEAATRRALLAPRTFHDIRRLVSLFDAMKDVMSIDSVMTTFSPSQDFYDDLTTLIDNLPSNAVPVPDTFTVSISKYEPPEAITARWVQSWKQKKPEIRIYMLLQILWLGTPAEVLQAKRALEEQTGHKFATTTEWGTWWQSKQ
jgi:hypothetical protein